MAGYDVVLLPTYAQVDEYRKQAADACAAGLFSCTVTTFPAWIADLWELHGDGRKLVDAVERLVVMSIVLEHANARWPGNGFDAPGMVGLAARCVQRAAGLAAFEQALVQATAGSVIAGLSGNEHRLLEAIADYKLMIADAGYVELGDACAFLARKVDDVFPDEITVSVEYGRPLNWQERMFLECTSHLSCSLEPAFSGSEIALPPANVDVRFAFPMGGYAAPGLITEIVLDHIASSNGQVVITSADPFETYCRIERSLVDAGCRPALRTRIPFAQTDFGRAFLAMLHVVHDEPLDVDALSDVLLSPFSGVSLSQAYEIAVQLRKDRIAQRDESLANLCQLSDEFSRFEELARDPDADILLGSFEQGIMAMSGRTQAWKAEQFAAIAALRSALEMMRRFSAPMALCRSVLDGASVPVSCEVRIDADERAHVNEGARPHVLVASQQDASRFAPRSCELLIVADMTAEAYPVKDDDDAGSVLLEKLGLIDEDTALAKARRMFNALQQLPTQTFVLMRPVNDENADPTYPCAVYEEFVDGLLAEPGGSVDARGIDGLPEAFAPQELARGEELLYANARALVRDRMQQVTAHVDTTGQGVVACHQKDVVLPPRLNSTGVPLDLPCPSPSQIETYLECPRKWFATRRLDASIIDEQFGPLEKGSFAHAALERFYRSFQEQVAPKVLPDNIERARAIMREVVDELEAEQPLIEPGNNRLVACTQLEKRELAALKDQLVAFLDLEARFLPTYHPAYFEYQIDADHAADYAGYKLTGVVDRIDVDDAGHAVIVDYKGSLNAEYEIAGKTREHAGKVQTRIYAQVISRVLGLDVVGALYVSYGQKPKVSGAYDPRVLDAAHMPNMKADACRCGLVEQAIWTNGEADCGVDGTCMDEVLTFADLTFPIMLDETERLVGDAIAHMADGFVAPVPSYAGACKWCPILDCPGRLT